MKHHFSCQPHHVAFTSATSQICRARTIGTGLRWTPLDSAGLRWTPLDSAFLVGLPRPTTARWNRWRWKSWCPPSRTTTSRTSCGSHRSICRAGEKRSAWWAAEAPPRKVPSSYLVALGLKMVIYGYFIGICESYGNISHKHGHFVGKMMMNN